MSLFTSPVVRALDANGAPISGAKLYFYESGGLVAADTFTTDALTVAHASPVVADSGGLFAAIYLDPSITYRVILKNAAGTTIQDIDPYTASDQILHDVTISEAPDTLGNFDDASTAFDGDLSKVNLAFNRSITGTDTLGEPTTGYEHVPEAGTIIGYVTNESGHNEGTADNVGRTGAQFAFIKVDNYGQGDLAALTCTGFVNGARAGATSWLANPAIVMINGTMTAGAHGVYLNPMEVNLQPADFDAAAIGHVTNITRNTGDTVSGLGAYCVGNRVQSNGTFKIDAAFSCSGPMKVVLDGTNATTLNAFATMPVGSKLYGASTSSDGLKATTLGSSYMESSSTGWLFSSMGFPTGVGGAVTQATSRTTGVTLNKVCGTITLVSAAGSTSFATFTVTNSMVGVNDTIRLTQQSGTDIYHLIPKAGAGSFTVTFATTSGTTVEQPVINFAVIKGVAA